MLMHLEAPSIVVYNLGGEVHDIVALIVKLKTMDSIRNLNNNIKAYGYLEFCSGSLSTKIDKNNSFNEFYNDIKSFMLEDKWDELINMHSFLIKHANSKKERCVIRTVIMLVIHNVNKELGLYNI